MKSKVEKILIRENNERPEISILTRFKSFSEISNGVFSPLERLVLKYPKATIYYESNNSHQKNLFLERNPSCKEYKGEDVDLEIKPDGFSPWELIGDISKNIEEDIPLLKDSWLSKIKLKTESFHIVGKLKHLYIHEKARILPGVVFDVTSGPIVIDRDVKITPFTYLAGPLYIGRGSQIDNARIGGGTIIGSVCRIGGEVENSIFGDYSNKHHEGFVGHSIVGNWVNFGALATTSDLKNNYGNVKIQIKKNIINTNTIKFGSIVGDFCKIAIGTMLNTGCVLDVGSNIVADRVGGYLPSFTWVNTPNKYRLDLFLKDARKIMARRDVTMQKSLEDIIRSVYES